MFMIAFILVILLMVIQSKHLLLLLLLMEILGFITIYLFSSYCWLPSDYMLLFFFSLVVIEGVMGLSGLISMVSYSGSDYFLSSSVLKV